MNFGFYPYHESTGRWESLGLAQSANRRSVLNHLNMGTALTFFWAHEIVGRRIHDQVSSLTGEWVDPDG